MALRARAGCFIPAACETPLCVHRLRRWKLVSVPDAGLAPDWQSTAVARISPSGRISNIALTHRSREDPDSLMRVESAISEALQVGGIDLPPPDTTISLAATMNRSTTGPTRDHAAG